MKNLLGILLAILICLTQPAQMAFADAGDVTIFDFINTYDKPVTQSTLSADELAALASAPGDVYDKAEYATYTLKQVAFDGCSAYIMVEVTPKSDDVLLMSDYMYEPGDTRPLEDSDVSETFETKAARDKQSIIVSGIGVDILNPELEHVGSSASEKYFSDGSMLLYLNFAFKESMGAAPRSIDIRIRECEYGADYNEYMWPISLTPTAQIKTAQAQVEQSVASGRMIVESITYRRSEIGAIMNISGHLGEKMSADDIDFITALEADVNFGDDTIGVTGGGMMCFNAEGENIYFEDAMGGETFLITLSMGAGKEPAQSASIAFKNYETGERMDEFSTELVYE